MALDFTITSPTTALGAGTPSRAISLTLTGSGTLGSAASFALSDGSAGGSFYPASPVTIASGQTVGAVTQFLYTPAPGASGTITLTATCSGGLTATHTLALIIATNATQFISDAFAGSSGTDLSAHTPGTGGAWVKTGASSGTEALQLDGSGFISGIGAGHIFNEYLNATPSPSAEYDVACSIKPVDSTNQIYSGILGGAAASPAALDGYRFFLDNVGGAWGVIAYNSGTNVIAGGTTPTVTNGTTYVMRLAVRTLNGQQCVSALVNGAHLTGSPVIDSNNTGRYVGFLPEIAAGVTGTLSNGVKQSAFVAALADWSNPSAPTLVVTPTSGSVVDGSTTLSITATLTNSLAGLTASVTGGGAISTTTPTSGAAFTYTPPSTGTGTATVTVTDTTDSIVRTCTVSYSGVSNVFDFASSQVSPSPSGFLITGGSGEVCSPGGSSIKFRISGTTTLTATVDTTINNGVASANMPSVKVILKGNNGQNDSLGNFVLFPSTNNANASITLASGLNSGLTYDVLLEVAVGDLGSNGWTGRGPHALIKQFQIDSGGVVSNSPILPKRAMVFGDSYLQAYFGTGGSPYYTFVDFTRSWPKFVCWALGAEYSQVGNGGQGWVQAPSSDGVTPAFPQTWNKYDSSHTKTFNNIDYVLIAMNVNDHSQSSGSVQAAVASFIPAARTAFGPSTKLFFVLNIAGIQSAPVIAAVSASGDAQSYVIAPPNDYFQSSVFNGSNQPSWATPDGLHLDAVHQSGMYGAFVTQGIQAILSSASGAGSYAFSS